MSSAGRWFLLVVGVVAALVVLVALIEMVRRARARAGGWVDYIRNGAPVRNDDLVAAIEGRLDRLDEVALVRAAVGAIDLPSGRVAARDPGRPGIDEIRLCEVAFPRGRFTVHALVGTRDGDQRCAAPWIRFTDEPIARLEVAFEENTPPIAERRCELPSIGVDSGTVALGSPEALAAAPATPGTWRRGRRTAPTHT